MPSPTSKNFYSSKNTDYIFLSIYKPKLLSIVKQFTKLHTREI